MSLDYWLKSNLVCPRDHGPLRTRGNQLVCPADHVYPIIDDIPIMLLDDVTATHEVQYDTLRRTAADTVATAPGGSLPNNHEANGGADCVDQYVQDVVGATCGYLYKRLVGELTRYPIPDLRLPSGSGEMFLDVGCNWGRWCVAAARKKYSPVGIDPSLDAVTSARKVSQQLGVAARYVVADARYLPFGAETFDVVFSYSVLQHFSKENVQITLAQVARVLKERGTCFIQMPNIYGVRCLFHQAKRGFREARAFEVRYWKPRQLTETFETFIGPTSLSVDGYFGLGIQGSDVDLLPRRYQLVVRLSETLRAASRNMPWMTNLADSIFVNSIRESDLARTVDSRAAEP